MTETRKLGGDFIYEGGKKKMIISVLAKYVNDILNMKSPFKDMS